MERKYKEPITISGRPKLILLVVEGDVIDGGEPLFEGKCCPMVALLLLLFADPVYGVDFPFPAHIAGRIGTFVLLVHGVAASEGR